MAAEQIVHDLRNRLAIARANIEAFIDGKFPPTAERLRAVLRSLGEMEQLLRHIPMIEREGPSTRRRDPGTDLY